MKKFLPFLLAGIIAELPILLSELTQTHAGRGDGFGTVGVVSLFYGIIHLPVYALILLLRVPEPYHSLAIYPLGSLFLAAVFWSFVRFFIAPYRTKANKEAQPNTDGRNA